MWYDLYFVRCITSPLIFNYRLSVLSFIKGFCHYFWPFTFSYISYISYLITKTCLWYYYRLWLAGSEPYSWLLGPELVLFIPIAEGKTCDCYQVIKMTLECKNWADKQFNAASLFLLILDLLLVGSRSESHPGRSLWRGWNFNVQVCLNSLYLIHHCVFT